MEKVCYGYFIIYYLIFIILYVIVILLCNISLLQESVFIDGILTFQIIFMFLSVSVQVLLSFWLYELPTFNVIFNDTFSALVVCYLTLCIEYFKHLHLIKLYLDFSRLMLVILKTFFIATICCSTDKLATN